MIAAPRPELAPVDGCHPPAGLPSGDFWARREADGSVWIDRADPRLLISAEIVDQAADDPSPVMWLDTAGCDTYIGALLKITGVNRRVIYRLTGWISEIRAFISEWPD